MRIIVGVSGATGAIFGVRTLEVLAQIGVETHLVLTTWGARTIEHETTHTVEHVRKLASTAHGINDQAASISSGSFRTNGMVISPCSMKTAAAIAHGFSSNLLVRAADVVLKERRPLVLLIRESPLSTVHLRNLLTLSEMGVTIIPPVPAFYNHPATIDEMVDHIVMRSLDQFDLESSLTRRWDGRLRRPGADEQ